jgi:hypothetical protein
MSGHFRSSGFKEANYLWNLSNQLVSDTLMQEISILCVCIVDLLVSALLSLHYI